MRKPGAVILRPSKFRIQAGLLANLVGGDTINMGVSLDGNGSNSVGVDRMIPTLVNESEPVFLEVAYQVLAFDRP